MKKMIIAVLAFTLLSSMSFGQEEIRRHSSGPRRQLATIVFAGLGGAILGLSTLSFYGRPQDQLSNIAIGFAVGIIAGTTYVTVRSATSRDYYDEKPPQTLLGLPPSNLLADSSEISATDSADSPTSPTAVDVESSLVYGPLITRVSPESLSYGGMLGFRF